MIAKCIHMLDRCSLKNGELTVPGVTSGEDIKILGDELRDVILKEELPHYKVIGMKITTGNANRLTDYITKATGVNRSYAELLGVCKKLICADIVKGFIPMNSSDEKFTGSFLEYGYVMGVDKEVKSDNGTLFFEGQGVDSLMQCLVKDLDIVKFENPSTCLHLILKRGTGVIEFAETSSMLHSTDYVPMGQAYDLSEILSVKMYEEGDRSVIFRYKSPIDEKVLERIITKYAKDLL